MLSRRTLLHQMAGTAVGVAANAALPIGGFGASAGLTVSVVLFAEQHRARDVMLDGTLSVFSRRGIPVGIALPPITAPLSAEASSAVAPNTMYRLRDVLPPEPYFQMRALSAARQTLAPCVPAPGCINALCAPDPGGDLNLRGLRVAGFRTAVMVPEESGPTTIETHHAQTVVTRGGHWVQSGQSAAVRAYLEAAIQDPTSAHATLLLDLEDLAGGAAKIATEVADIIASFVAQGTLTPLAPQEIGVRHFAHFKRLIGLLLDGAPDDETQAIIAATSQSLTQAGIDHSRVTSAADDIGPTGCLRVDISSLEPGAPVPRGLACAVAKTPAPSELALLADQGAKAILATAEHGFFGLDSNGLVHLRSPLRAAGWKGIATIETDLSLVDEPVIVLDAGALAKPAQRNAVVAALRRLSELPGTRIVDLATFADRMANPDPVFETMRTTRIAAPEIAPVPDGPLSDDGRAALLDDARRAWRYFDALRQEASGMPAASCQFSPEGKPGATYDNLTQWDMGSVIFAHIAALDLGIIDQQAFQIWRDKAIETLRAATLPGWRLPRGYFLVTAPQRGSTEFNARDAGRLLSALHVLDQRAPEGDTAIRELVEGWDIASTVIDGVPHSLENGKFIPYPDTHCSSYTARAYQLWGIVAKSAYSVYYKGETQTDHQMHLLHEVADIGNIGAEPLLLESLELGPTTPIGYLTDVLFAAQLEGFAETGKVIAPSESPREESPWFTYQGLRVDMAGEARWDVMVPGDGESYRTAEFRERTRMIASKTAFLWAAARPHPYSSRLLAYVRAHARLPTGFASGTYTANDRPTRDYGDVNTNGIILQVIAGMLAD